MSPYWLRTDITLLQKLKIHLRIADYQAGYPSGEAMYTSIKDYEKSTGLSFGVQLETLDRAADGSA